MLTLFGMILAIGLVVDDAIIVVENVEHNMAAHGTDSHGGGQKGDGRAGRGTGRHRLVLGSVFLPVAFLGGMTGTLYKQFAITIAISMVISGSRGADPLAGPGRPHPQTGSHEKKGFFKWFENGFTRLTNGYVVGVRWLINHKMIGLALFGGVIVAVVFLFKMVPGSFVPEEDQGYLFVANIMPDAASLERTTAVSDQAAGHPERKSGHRRRAQLDGYSIIDSQNKTNAALLFASLKPYEERKGKEGRPLPWSRISAKNLPPSRRVSSFPINPPSIPGLGTTGGFEFYIQSKGSGRHRRTWRKRSKHSSPKPASGRN